MKKSFKLFTLITLTLLASCGANTSETVKPTESTPATDTAKPSESSESTDTAPVVIAVESIDITNGASIDVNEGESVQLNAVVLPENATDKTITWTCSNPDAATVDANGLFTAKEVKSDLVVKVTAKAGEKETSIDITIKNVVKATTITFSEGHYTTAIKDPKESYSVDDSVTFTVVTDSGYDIETVLVQNADGNSVLTPTSYGIYSFALTEGENKVVITEKEVDMKGYSFAKVYNDPHYANFTADDAVTVYSNNWQSNLLVKEASDEIKATDSYTVSAHIQTQSSAPVDYNQLAVGMVVYYEDESNYLIGYTQWVDFDKDGWCREFNLTGFINGTDVGWHDMWLEGAEINPSEGYDFSIRRENSNFTFSLVYKGTEYKKNTSISDLGDKKTTSLGIFNQDKNPVTYTNISYAKYVAPEYFEITSGSATVTDVDGTVTYTVPTSNWKTGFAVKNFNDIADTTHYTISTHMQTTGSTPFTAEAYWGIVVYYKDEGNFLMLYSDYNAGNPNSRGLHMIGNKDGAVITPE